LKNPQPHSYQQKGEVFRQSDGPVGMSSKRWCASHPVTGPDTLAGIPIAIRDFLSDIHFSKNLI